MIRVEFYGVARRLAGTPEIKLDVGEGVRLGEVLRTVTVHHPELIGDCIAEDRLGPTFIANLDGDRFVRDPDTPIRAGQTVMILSADAGG